jgi:hypothetical protein
MLKKTIAVLGNGEIWAMAENVILCRITEEQLHELAEGASPNQLKHVTFISATAALEAFEGRVRDQQAFTFNADNLTHETLLADVAPNELFHHPHYGTLKLVSKQRLNSQLWVISAIAVRG